MEITSQRLGAAGSQSNLGQLWAKAHRQGSRLVGYVWLLPAMAIVAAIVLLPAAGVIRDSLTNRTTFEAGQYVGAANYRVLLTDGSFWQAIRNNLAILLNVPLTIVGGMAVAMILYRGLRGSRFYQSAIFISFLPSVASICVIFTFLLNIDGSINSALRSVGLSSIANPWLTRPSTAIWSVLFVMSWHRFGFVTVLFLTRLLGLDATLLDAAATDGASYAQAMRYVAIPQMRSIVAFVATLGVIDAFSYSFGYIFVLTRGGPFQSTVDLGFLLYETLFLQHLVGRASAVAATLLVIAVIAAVIRMRAAKEMEAQV